MKLEIPEWVKPAVWGGIVGAVLVTIIGFSADWVITTGTAETQAERRAEQAVIASLTPICVAQFKKAAQEAEATHLAALQEEDSWMRGDYVEKQGWATMPGSKASKDAVADACAEELIKISNKKK